MIRENVQHVPLLDLDKQFEPLEDEIRAAINKVYSHKRFIMGPEVEELEKQLAHYCNVKHAISCASGSDALLLSLMALGISAGDYVITSPFTFFATAGAIARLGARPVFLDINADDYNIDPAEIELFMSGNHPLNELFPEWQTRTRAIIPVHLYGQMADMGSILEIAQQYDLRVVEDAAQAIGAVYDGKNAGSLGDTGCFSFFPSKNLGAFGDGGCITTNNDKLAEKLSVLRLHGAKPKYHHSMVGMNSRLDTLQAAVLLVKLPYIDEWNRMRHQNAETYKTLLQKNKLITGVTDCMNDCNALGDNRCSLNKHMDKLIPPKETTGSPKREGRHVYHQFVVRTPRRDALKNALDQASIGNSIYYPVPLHEQQCFAGLGYRAGYCSKAACAAKQTLALPMFPELDREQQQHVVSVIHRFLTKNK